MGIFILLMVIFGFVFSGISFSNPNRQTATATTTSHEEASSSAQRYRVSDLQNHFSTGATAPSRAQ